MANKDETSESKMTNEQRVAKYAKEMFSNRYTGFLIYRNPPPTETEQPKSKTSATSEDNVSKSKQGGKSQAVSSSVMNPVASTVGSKIFSKPELNGLQVDSDLQVNARKQATNEKNNQTTAPSVQTEKPAEKPNQETNH